jgi:hypothetical protein
VNQFFILFLLLFPLCAAAESFASVEAYLEYVANGRQIVSSKFESSDGGSVVGVVQWSAPEKASETQSPYLASVFVLERLKNNGYKEVVRSSPSGGFNGGNLEIFSEVDIKSKSRFAVNLHSFKPPGGITYRFALVDQSWHLSGRDEYFCGYSDDDESVCETRVERSSNFLTGKVIEKNFRGDRLIRTNISETKFPRFSLIEFMVFDERYEHQ